MQKYTTNFSLQILPTFDLVSFHSTQLKDTLLRFLTPTLAIVLQHRFKVLQQKNYPFLNAFELLFATQFYSSDPCFFIISQHQPLISILTLNYTTTLLNNWCSRIDAPPSSLLDPKKGPTMLKNGNS